MEQIFRIAKCDRVGQYLTIGKKSKIDADSFWDLVKSKVQEITKDHPDEFDRVLKEATNHLKGRDSLTIKDTYFKIESGPKKKKTAQD